MRGSVESPFEAQLQETVAMELNTGAMKYVSIMDGIPSLVQSPK